MERLRSIAALLVFGVFVAAGGAAAATERIAALVPQTRPPAASELRDRFQEAVTRGLQTGSDEVVPAAEVRLRLGATEDLLGCSGTGPCVARSAQTLRTERVVATDIDINGKDYSIKLRLLDTTGRELTKIEEPCDICTVKEADDAIARAATKLAAATRALSSETPKPDLAPPPAPKPETAVKPAPPPEPTVQSAPPEPTTATAHREKKMFPWRPVAIASLAAGVVGLAVGIPLLAIDGHPTCDKPNPMQSCPEVYNTVGGGATLLTLGLLGGAASGVLFYLDHRARAKPRPTVLILPVQGGAYVSTGGRF
jgi:hypothetical protein